MSTNDDEKKKDVNLECETGLGFSQRDKNVKTQEEKGLLDFKVITNDGSMDNMKLLTDLKNIIAKQLPKRPKEYIVRLVFDRKHESMVIIKSGSQKVVGGICYRPNYTQGFIEIAFLAISSLEQVKGYGTRLMNKLKDHCKEKNLKYFLTYADNNAIGYFKKQGFNMALKMPMEKWKDYIKDYDGGTLMEAYCNPMIDYSNLSETIKQQKNTIKEFAMRFLSVKRKQEYSELEKAVKKAKLSQSELIKNGEISKELFDIIPGMKSSGWTYEDYQKQLQYEKDGNTNFISQCRNIITKLKSNKNSWPFAEPVNAQQVPDYYETIKEPMDLQTLEKGLESGKYKNKTTFEKDLRKIFSNARTYNKVNSIYHKYATMLENMIEDDINNLRED